MKKCFIWILIVFVLGLGVYAPCFLRTRQNLVAFAATSYTETESGDVEDAIKDQMNDLPLEEYEKILNELTQQGLLPNIAFKDFIWALLQGESVLGDSPSVFFTNILQGVWSQVKPIILVLLVLGILLGVYKHFTSGRADLEKVIYFAIYTVVVFIVVYIIKHALELTSNAIYSMHKQMDALFPVLLTLLTATGAVKSAGVYQPLVYVLSQGVTSIFSKVLLPLCFIVFIFCVVNSLSTEIKVGKMKGFISSVLKWGMGVTCSVFLSILTMKGFMVSASDGISIKFAKYSVKHYVPIVGGFVSDGFEIVRASSVLLKNAIGIGGIWIVLQSVCVPLLSLLFFQLLFKFLAGVLEPVTDARLCNFFDEISTCMKYFFALIIGVCVMYIFSMAMIIFTANGVV